jgi:hypothetical protein
MLPDYHTQLKKSTAFILLILVTPMPIGAVATEGHATSLMPLAEHSFWLYPLTSQVYLYECVIGDILEGSFTVATDGELFMGDQKEYDLWLGWGDGVDLYIFDNQTYEDWLQGMSTDPLYSQMDVTELSWRSSIPDSGFWYVVYDNDSSIYGKQIKGTINHLPQNLTVILVLIAVVACLITLVIGITVYKTQ